MLEMLLPRRCVLCGDRTPGLCAACATSLPAAPDLGAPPGLTQCRSLVTHEGSGRDLVLALKYRAHLDAVPALGAALADLARRDDGPGNREPLVTWAPTSPRRARRRGFDQAEVLARSVAGHLGAEVRPTLRRMGSGSQTGRGRGDRLDGPLFEGVVAVRGPVLVVDDVRTTGATLCAAADALIRAGADPVDGLTLAVRL